MNAVTILIRSAYHIFQCIYISWLKDSTYILNIHVHVHVCGVCVCVYTRLCASLYSLYMCMCIHSYMMITHLEFLVSESWMILVTVMSMFCRLAAFTSFSIASFICGVAVIACTKIKHSLSCVWKTDLFQIYVHVLTSTYKMYMYNVSVQIQASNLASC